MFLPISMPHSSVCPIWHECLFHGHQTLHSHSQQLSKLVIQGKSNGIPGHEISNEIIIIIYTIIIVDSILSPKETFLVLTL